MEDRRVSKTREWGFESLSGHDGGKRFRAAGESHKLLMVGSSPTPAMFYVLSTTNGKLLLTTVLAELTADSGDNHLCVDRRCAPRSSKRRMSRFQREDAVAGSARGRFRARDGMEDIRGREPRARDARGGSIPPGPTRFDGSGAPAYGPNAYRDDRRMSGVRIPPPKGVAQW